MLSCLASCNKKSFEKQRPSALSVAFTLEEAQEAFVTRLTRSGDPQHFEQAMLNSLLPGHFTPDVGEPNIPNAGKFIDPYVPVYEITDPQILKGLMITMTIDTSTGKVREVNFEILENSIYSQVPIEAY
ncbi:MAG: DUF5043 domain-containing protein [Rikenellaceae bacterium]|nr:DUF5043 domain-containing protein [Rikenellaceae bacterium]